MKRISTLRRPARAPPGQDIVAGVGYRPSTPIEVGVKVVEWYVEYYGVKL